MGIDFVERFFKLTLDNVYRFVCSLMFLVAVVGTKDGVLPLGQLRRVLDWLAIPAGWLTPVQSWIELRGEFVATVGVMTLLVALSFAAANGWKSRSGSTTLLSFVALFQTGRSLQLLIWIVVVLALVAASTAITVVVAGRFGWGAPEWPRMVWECIGRVVGCTCFSALYFLSPLGWMASQEASRDRGTLWHPVYVKQIASSGPTGAKP